ncbi:MAG: nitroreductase [Pseudomonadota bacterium]
MPERNPEVMDFLMTRRSRLAKTLGNEAPDRAEIETLLTAASRTPDHGRLEPWRFVVITEGREELAALFTAHALKAGVAAERAEKNAQSFSYGGVIIAVIASPKVHPTIPAWEQELAAGAVCLSLLNAALASGWGANWLTGPMARDAGFLAEAFGCTEGEFVAGYIHIGNEEKVPTERGRPDVAAITTWR